jgi:iron complex outermembrane receptor protein
LGTTHTQIKQNDSAPQYIGNATPRNTTWKLDAGVQYSKPITDRLNGIARVDYEHRGKEYWQVDNLAVQRPINLVNARLGIEGADGAKWGIYLWTRNLLNIHYYNDVNVSAFSGLPYDIGSLAEPRTYGVEARMSF